MWNNNNNYGPYGGYGTYPYPNQQQNMPTQTNNFNNQYNGNQQQGNGQFYFINNVTDAQTYMIPPNSTSVFIDKASNKIYVKTADAQGQATLQEFGVSQPEPLYVTKKEFEEFKQQFLKPKQLPVAEAKK